MPVGEIIEEIVHRTSNGVGRDGVGRNRLGHRLRADEASCISDRESERTQDVSGRCRLVVERAHREPPKVVKRHPVLGARDHDAHHRVSAPHGRVQNTRAAPQDLVVARNEQELERTKVSGRALCRDWLRCAQRPCSGPPYCCEEVSQTWLGGEH